MMKRKIKVINPGQKFLQGMLLEGAYIVVRRTQVCRTPICGSNGHSAYKRKTLDTMKGNTITWMEYSRLLLKNISRKYRVFFKK